MKDIFTLISALCFLLGGYFISYGQRKELNTGWTFRQYQIGRWLPATVPGTVHTDLMANKQIKDPFFRNQEKEVQWVDKVNWEYAVTFQIDDTTYAKSHQQLVFYGLDTWCDIFLNDEKIMSTDNMFRTWKVPVTGKLQRGENRLHVKIWSPIIKGLEEIEKYGMALPASNDYSEYGGMGPVRVSVYSRKAPYHFGWDWGPRLVTSGIWRPVVLESWDDVKIDHLFIRQPSVNRSLANLEAEVNFIAGPTSPLQIELFHNGKVMAKTGITPQKGENRITLPFSIKNPELWWSNGLGKQHLYHFTVRIKKEGRIIAQENITTGLRSLKLIRQKDPKGESFGFELNGVPVFAKGTNSIPNDVFLPRITRSDYKKMVTDVADANMNMIRIWGGGIYEDDYFYELCDRKGILVWQDFMFACAMYPGTPEFLENVRQEATDNIIRLRNHPCIALWCGNNEIDLAWRHDTPGGWGWKQAYSKAQQETIFKAYTDVFHHILPEVIAQYTDGDNYWPSSPMAGPGINQHNVYTGTSGDNHYWGVWHESHPLEKFEENIGRFMSEYGFQSFPEFTTVRKYALPEDYHIESEVMSAHQRSGIGNLRIKEYMNRYYRLPEDFEQFLYLSQVLQARATTTAMKAHRKAMPYCMGSLIWQLNDCWPVASWSTTDYYHNWKAAHYAIREACKPVMLAPVTKDKELLLWIVNDRIQPVQGSYTVELFDFNGKLLNNLSGRFTANANSSGTITGIDIKTLLQEHSAKEVVAVISIHKGKELLDQVYHYFALPKELNLSDPIISTQITERKGEKQMLVKTDKLACNVMFYIPDHPAFFSDNYIDLLPGKTYQIIIKTELPAEKINVKTRYIR